MEWNTQLSILDALPAHIALLNGEGGIFSVNSGWRDFAIANNYSGDDFGVGSNYIAICENALGECSEQAQAVADGIRAVLNGERKRFTLEYACHSPTEQRWFQMIISPLMLDFTNGAVIMHVNITGRKLAENALRISEERIESIANNLPGYFFRRIRKADGRIEYDYVSPSIQRLFHLDPQAILADGQVLTRALHPEDRRSFIAALERSARELVPLQAEYRLLLPTGEIRWMRSLAETQRFADGTVRWDGIGLDITAQKQAESQLTYLAYNDVLTGLPNRFLFEDRLEQALALTHRHQQMLALHYLNLGNFKDINDTQGYRQGDEALRAVGQRLQALVRQSDTVARLGGDEFGVIQHEVRNVEQAAILAQKLLQSIAQPLHLAGKTITLEASDGVVLYPVNSDQSEPDTAITGSELLKRANIALREAKGGGHNTYCLYQHDMEELVQNRMRLRQALHQALAQQEFQLHYQPQIDLKTGKIIGVEALLRWAHPQLGMQRPDQFIPLAEETGLIVPVGTWVLHTACAQAKSWQEQGLPTITLAVNISAVQIQRGRLVEAVQKALERTGLAPQYLELELTESILASHLDDVSNVLNQLKDLGVQLAIDDFGTGYSSFHYLKIFSVDTLKIDQTFVRNLTVDSRDAALVRAMIAMARSLGVHVVAEGVETLEQWHFLSQEGCGKAQGYYFSAPLFAEDFVWLLQEGVTF